MTMQLTQNEQQQLILLQKAASFLERARQAIQREAKCTLLLELEHEITRMGRDPLEAIINLMEAHSLNTLTLRNQPTGK